MYRHKSAHIIGNVETGNGSSVWPGAVLRGDLGLIRVGDYSNVQDNCVIHCNLKNPTRIGTMVSIGHCAVIHGTTLEDCVIVGMNAVTMNGSSIGSGSIVAAGTVVPEKTTVPPYSLVIGNPCVIKEGRYTNFNHQIESAMIYYILSIYYNKDVAITPELTSEIHGIAEKYANDINDLWISGIDSYKLQKYIDSVITI